MTKNGSLSRLASSPRPTRQRSRFSREAARLLHALGHSEAFAIADPLDEDRVLIRCVAGAISLGGGAFSRAALHELMAEDLVERSSVGDTRRSAISDSGRAHLLRAAHPGDDAFLSQHRDLAPGEIATEDGPRKVVINASESPLAWLRRRRDRDGEPLIDAAAFEAGERLRRDITQACLMPSVTSRWDPSASSMGSGPRDPSAVADVVVAARQRVRKAMAAVGRDFADLLLDLCGFLKGVETLERERGWPPRSGKIVVRLALGRLADHYGLRPIAEGPAASRGIRTWHALLDAEPDLAPA